MTWNFPLRHLRSVVVFSPLTSAACILSCCTVCCDCASLDTKPVACHKPAQWLHASPQHKQLLRNIFTWRKLAREPCQVSLGCPLCVLKVSLTRQIVCYWTALGCRSSPRGSHGGQCTPTSCSGRCFVSYLWDLHIHATLLTPMVMVMLTMMMMMMMQKGWQGFMFTGIVKRW